VSLPTIVIEPRTGLWKLGLKAVWDYRELLYFIVWRNVKVRYKQTLLGPSWAVLQPLISMAIFTVIFGAFAKIPSDGLPYAVFSYTGLVPWVYFADAMSRSSTGLVTNSQLITKVYFPRLVIPLASVASPTADVAWSFLVLVGMVWWFGLPLRWTLVAAPLFLLLAMATALAVALWMSPLYARFRDVGYVVPFAVQIWMYVSPVVYPVSLVPAEWRLAYSLNPIAGVIEGFRWAVLGQARPNFHVVAGSTAVVLVLLATGLVYFRRMERTLADRI
jgi:lipopolysaccharide transport system permease protein